MIKLTTTVALLAISLTCASLKAGVFTEFTSGTNYTGSAGYVGQEFTTPSGGPWDDITFNFFSNEGPATTPNAQGDLFLTSTEYVGTPAGLSTSIPGFIAEALSSSISGGAWVLSPSVTLQPSSAYYVYSDALFSAGSITGASAPSGATFLFSPSSTTDFVTSPASANFEVSGSAVSAVPEPGTVSTILLGAFAVAGFAARLWRVNALRRDSYGARS